MQTLEQTDRPREMDESLITEIQLANLISRHGEPIGINELPGGFCTIEKIRELNGVFYAIVRVNEQVTPNRHVIVKLEEGDNAELGGLYHVNPYPSAAIEACENDPHFIDRTVEFMCLTSYKDLFISGLASGLDPGFQV